MYVYRVLVCATFHYTYDLFCCSAGICLLSVWCAAFRTSHVCLKPSVAFLIGDHKSSLTVHSASYILAMCGKFNGYCYVYDVQHLEYHTCRLQLFEAKCCHS